MRTVGNTKIQIFSFESTYGPKDEKANILVKYYKRQIWRNESEHKFFSQQNILVQNWSFAAMCKNNWNPLFSYENVLITFSCQFVIENKQISQICCKCQFFFLLSFCFVFRNFNEDMFCLQKTICACSWTCINTILMVGIKTTVITYYLL